ncbi:hypothetical protein GEMRC1_005780 [Eukaryota sp. GEM-RC1]
MSTFKIAQLSDLHFFSAKDVGVMDFFTKRAFSLLNGKMSSNRVFDVSAVPTMLQDAYNNSVNTVLITGDSTCLGTPEEFSLCKEALLQSPFYVDDSPQPTIADNPYPISTNNQIFVTLGNHDDLVPSKKQNYQVLRPFIPREFPRVFSTPHIDILNLNSAFGQILPMSAKGKVDITQRNTARTLLNNRSSVNPLFTMLHHSPTRRTLPTHALLEEEAFERFIGGNDEAGNFLSNSHVSDYVLHGHTHVPSVQCPFTSCNSMVVDCGSSTQTFRSSGPSYFTYEFLKEGDESKLLQIVQRSFSKEEVVETVWWSVNDPSPSNQ